MLHTNDEDGASSVTWICSPKWFIRISLLFLSLSLFFTTYADLFSCHSFAQASQ